MLLKQHLMDVLRPSLIKDLKQVLSCSDMDQAKPVYIPPKDLGKYSPHQSSLQQLPVDSKGLREGYDSCMSVTDRPLTF